MHKKWKISHENDAKGLKLSPYDWLELLTLRTSGSAAEVVNGAFQMAAEDLWKP